MKSRMKTEVPEIKNKPIYISFKRSKHIGQIIISKSSLQREKQIRQKSLLLCDLHIMNKLYSIWREKKQGRGNMNVGNGIAVCDKEASKGLTEKVTFKSRVEEVRRGALWGSVGEPFRQRQ